MCEGLRAWFAIIGRCLILSTHLQFIVVVVNMPLVSLQAFLTFQSCQL